MKAPCRIALALCFAAWLPPVRAGGQAASATALPGSARLCLSPTAPAAAARSAGVIPGTASRPAGMRPFSAIGIGVRAGMAGIGLEIATPLANRVNLRGGGNFLSIGPTFAMDGINVLSDIQLRSGFVALDLFPFHGAFHISPGYTLYNGDHLSAKARVPVGQSFDLGDATYFSDTNDPVHGTFDLSFGKKSAPRLTLGWGNMLPRKGGHWSFPFEVGAEYIGKPPRVTLALEGTVCEGPGSCQPIQSNPTAQANVALEQDQINADIPSWLRFYPLVSTGISYRFGRGAAAER